jgi:DNA-binding Lrp family transcriptional regulator
MISTKTRFRRKQGRKNSSLPFVQLFKYMLHCPAWLALSATAKAAYVQLALRYDGVNNSMLALSVRVLAEELQCSKSTARRALIELEDAGFIATVKLGRFARRNRKASEYRLTTHRCDVTGELPTKKFMRLVMPDTIGEVPTMKPWQAEGISEATWYRRRRAARQGTMTVSRVHLETVTGSPEDCHCHVTVPRVHQEDRQPCHDSDDGFTGGTLIESHQRRSGGTVVPGRDVAGMMSIARHFEEQHAIDAAWRWFRRQSSRTVRLSEIIDRVHARCPDVDPVRIRREVEDRLARTRSHRSPECAARGSSYWPDQEDVSQ